MFRRGELAADERRVPAAVAVPERLARVLAALEEPGSTVLLIGADGNGKGYLAEYAAEALRERATGPLETVVLPLAPAPADGAGSVFAADFGVIPAEQGPADAAIAVRESVGARCGADAVVVARGIDEYGAYDAQVLEHLARSGDVRLIATAERLTDAVDRVSRGPRRARLSVGPLAQEEAGRYLSALLGVDRIETETLSRWYRMTEGNGYALSLLALSHDEAGRVRRSRGTAWVLVEEDRVPGDLADLLAGDCSPGERATLETVAFAQPITETALLRELDAGHLAALFDRGLVVSTPGPNGDALAVRHRLLKVALRAGLSPLRRIELGERMFGILDADRGGLDPTLMPDRLQRLVSFGIWAGRELPLDWIWTALEVVGRTGSPRFVLRLATAVAAHPDASPLQAGSAALRASRIAKLLGDEPALRGSFAMIERMLDERADAMPPGLRVSLETKLVRHRVLDGSSVGGALGALDRLDAAYAGSEPEVLEVLRSARVWVLASAGRLREAAEACPPTEVSPDLKVEWARSPARAIAALILEQQGRATEAIASAEHARSLARLGPRARADVIHLQGFCGLVGYWVSGSPSAAASVLDELMADTGADASADARYSGLVEFGIVLLGLQEGRWSESAQTAELLVGRLEVRDVYGLLPAAHAAMALALAVLGEDRAAERSIRASEVPAPGVAQVLGGMRRLLTLRARHWIRDPGYEASAGQLRDWARAEGLPLIELQALHLLAYERRACPPAEIERARELAARVEPHLAEAFLGHLAYLADAPGRQEESAAGEEPEIRVLASYGIWLPLPPAPALTAREREIVLLAALGHTSRFIAERLHISARTVETHLSNAFAKTGVENRDGLWRWAARERVKPLRSRA